MEQSVSAATERVLEFWEGCLAEAGIEEHCLAGDFISAGKALRAATRSNEVEALEERHGKAPKPDLDYIDEQLAAVDWTAAAQSLWGRARQPGPVA